MKALASSSLVEDASVLNPIKTMEKRRTVTIKASTSAEGISLSGSNKTNGYTMEKRAYDKTMLGTFALTTNADGNVGIVRQLTLEPNITSTNGYVNITPENAVDSLNAANLFSPAELTTPLSVLHDDPQRSAMMKGQTSQMVMTDDASPVLIGNKVESVAAYHMNNEFAFVAKDNGEVIDIQDGIYIIQYKNGKRETFDTNPVIHKNAADGMFTEIEFKTKLVKGSKFKKNEVIAYEPRAFTKNEDDLSASMNLGVLAKVAVVSIDDILEDSEPVTSQLSERLGYSAITVLDKSFDMNTHIEKMAKVGDHINYGDTLITFDSHQGDPEVENFLAEYKSALG